MYILKMHLQNKNDDFYNIICYTYLILQRYANFTKDFRCTSRLFLRSRNKDKSLMIKTAYEKVLSSRKTYKEYKYPFIIKFQLLKDFI